MGFLGLLKHQNPWASGGSTPWTPGATMELSMKIVQIDNSVHNFM